jgi:hypothetical protein
MECLSDLKNTLSTPSRKRTHIFLGIGIFLIVLIIIIICVAASGGKKEDKESNPSSPEEGDIEGKTPFDYYLNSKKYLYVWSYPNAENLIKFLVDHKYSKIYLYIGCIEWNLDQLIKGEFYNSGDIDAKELIKRLISLNIEVEPCIYINDNPNDFTNIDKAPEIAKALAEVQKSLKFTALHFDVEPQHNENLEALLKMYEECRKYIKVSAILKPGWLNKEMSSLESSFTSADYYKKFKDCETFIDAVMTVTDYSDLMAYSNTYSTIDAFLDKYETIRKRHTSNIAKPVLELDPAADDDSTYQRYKEDQDNFFNYFVNVSKKFDGVTIHHYTSWYQDLYCEKADSNYYFGKPKKC